jgi:ankyrin repeat protein
MAIKSIPPLSDLIYGKIANTLDNDKLDTKILMFFMKKTKEIQEKRPLFHANNKWIINKIYKLLDSHQEIELDCLKIFIRFYTCLISFGGTYIVIKQLNTKLSDAIEHANYPLLQAICDILKENCINYQTIQNHIKAPTSRLGLLDKPATSLHLFFNHINKWSDPLIAQAFKHLLDLGWPIDECNSFSQTPLHLACLYTKPSLVEFLIERGADENTFSQDDSTPFHFLAAAPNQENSIASDAILQLLSTKKNINYHNANGLTPLMLAAEHGNIDGLEALLRAGADATLKNPYSSKTALHLACKNRHHESVFQLIEAKAPINAADADGMTGLHQICSASTHILDEFDAYVVLKIIELLMEKGAVSNCCANNGKLPYDLLKENYKPILEHIIKENPSFFDPYHADPETFASLTKKLPLPTHHTRLKKANADQIKAYFSKDVIFSHEIFFQWLDMYQKKDSLPLANVQKVARKLLPVLQMGILSIKNIERVIQKRKDYEELKPFVEEKITAFRNKLENIKKDINLLELALSQGEIDEIPDAFRCPITKGIMQHPVKDRYGDHYDEKALQQWLKTSRFSPIGKGPLIEGEFESDKKLKDRIEQYLSKKRRPEIDDSDSQNNKWQKL